MSGSLILLRPYSTYLLRRRWRRGLVRASRHVAAYVACIRQGYAAAALYEDLARLSKAGRERRGVWRGDLHRHIASRLGKPKTQP
jgi:hypothetical protein